MISFCHPTSPPTLSYAILPELTTSYLVLHSSGVVQAQ